MPFLEIPAELAEQLEAIAHKMGKSKDRLIADLLADFVDSEDGIGLTDDNIKLCQLQDRD
jgi:predicted transcriptional regulator